jgi:hypothetical protein
LKPWLAEKVIEITNGQAPILVNQASSIPRFRCFGLRVDHPDYAISALA